MVRNLELERSDKRKSMTITIIVHVLLLILFLLPFIVQRPPDPFKNAIVITFDEPSSSSSSSSASSASSSGSRPKVAMAKINPTAQVRSVELPKTKPVITSPEPEISIPPSEENYFEEPLEVSEVAEADAVEELETASTGGKGEGQQDGSGFFEGEFEGEAEAGDNPFADGFFSGDWPGGDGSEGKNLGVGNLGDGNYYGDFSGDGLFDRKVIRRANVGQLAREQGKFVVDLCVDKTGKVYWAELNSDLSTISDQDLQKSAREVAMKYVYEPDADKDKECGRLTFIFKID